MQIEINTVLGIAIAVLFLITVFMSAYSYTESQESKVKPDKRLDLRVKAIGFLFWSLIFAAMTAYTLIGAQALCVGLGVIILIGVVFYSAYGIGRSLLLTAASFNLDKFMSQVIKDNDDRLVEEEELYPYSEDAPNEEEEPLPNLPPEVVNGMDRAIEEVAAKKIENKKKVEDPAVVTPEEKKEDVIS